MTWTGTEVDSDVAVNVGRLARLDDLYAQHIDAAARLAFLMTGDRQQAQDIAQDAFVRIAGRFHDLRNPDAFPAYLRKTVVNLSRSHLRRLRTQRAYLEKARAEPATDVTRDVETNDEMWQAVMMLSHRQRAVIVLRYYEDLSEDQVADLLQISRAAVKGLVNRALKDLRLRVRGGEHD